MDRPWARVPGSVGARLRPAFVATTDAIVAAVRVQVPEYARPLTGRFGERITEGVSVALQQFIALLGSDTDLPDTRIYRELGRVEHREGRTLAALQAAYQIGTRTAWQELGSSGAAHDLPPETIFALAEALFGYVEQLSAASVAGWAEEDASQAGSVQTRRNALVEALARRPPTAAPEIERLAVAAGWTVPAKVVALVVPDAVEVAARVPGAIAADLDPVGLAILPAVRVGGLDAALDAAVGALRGRRAVLGPLVLVAETFRSVARARAAWPLHASGLLGMPDEALLHADAHLVELLLGADPDLAADLQEKALGPLRDLPAGAAARSEETLRAWLDAHGDVTVAAAALHVHPQTVRYRLAQLRETYGGALDDPTARLEIEVGLRVRDGR
jgi:hypothetical protein